MHVWKLLAGNLGQAESHNKQEVMTCWEYCSTFHHSSTRW